MMWLCQVSAGEQLVQESGMSETGHADDLGRVVKILYKYALDPGGWSELVDAMREVAPGPNGEHVLDGLDEHFDLAAALAVKDAPVVHETFASLELSPALKILGLSPTAAEAFAPILGPLKVGDTLDPGHGETEAAIAGAIDILQSSITRKYPIVVSHGQKLSCSYLVRQPGTDERYAL